MELKGIYPIVPTPFESDGKVDLDSIDRLVQFLSERKVHGVAILGALGEGQKLTGDERGTVIRHYRKLIPAGMGLVVGVRAPATDPAKLMAMQARDLGADALLLGPHNVQKDAALLGYYLQVDETVGIPLVIHDYPAVTGITMSIELIAKMYEQGNNLNYLKLEDPPTGAKMQALAKLTGPGLKVFGALGGMYALEELELGAVGIMTGFVFAGLLVKLYDMVQAGEMDKAAALFYDFVPLNRWEFQPGIGVSLRKEIFKRMGIFNTAVVRHPGAVAGEECVSQMLRMIDHLRAKGYQL
ncbi:MAG: dihydrodipicolinate synthase family protein [Deltaproteobacteria bacterium]|nr:dihydrodipicolinate synthase family protein [Deltaproteobacteria bacterium]